MMSTVKKFGAVQILGGVMLSAMVLLTARATLNIGQAVNHDTYRGGCVVGFPAQLEKEHKEQADYEFFLWQTREYGYTEVVADKTFIKTQSDKGEDYFLIKVYKDGELMYEYTYMVLSDEEFEKGFIEAEKSYKQAKAEADAYRLTDEYRDFEASKCR